MRIKKLPEFSHKICVLGDETILVETPMEPVTVTPISQRRRQQLSDRLVELNKEFEISNKDSITDQFSTQEYLLDNY